jgi:hypothetical protein
VGAKTALLVYAEQHPAELLRQAPELDRDAASALVAATHPERPHPRNRCGTAFTRRKVSSTPEASPELTSCATSR